MLYRVRFQAKHVTEVEATDTHAAILAAIDAFQQAYRKLPLLPVECVPATKDFGDIPTFTFPAEKAS